MIIRKLVGELMIRTDYNDEYYIVHHFGNMDGGALCRNNPVDFRSSDLQKKDGTGTIHLSGSSDEAVPCEINGAFIGANHGQPDGSVVYAPNHKKTLKDVGAIYVDEDGIKFTLYRVEEDYLWFFSENVGESVYNYKFVKSIKGNLKYLSDGEDTADVIVESQTGVQYLSSALRYKRRKLVGYLNGVPKTVFYSMECDYCEIIEEYDIINPATVCPELTKNRPAGGYTVLPDLANFGEPMLNHKMTYRILADGTMISDFELTKLQDVRWTRYMGVMYQEKINTFGGGIYRHFPKMKPLKDDKNTYDFSYPYPLRGGEYPISMNPTVEEFATNPDSPMERIVDYFRDTDGNDKIGFACGYLPVFDGAPEIRKNITSPIFLYHTRKAYPTFLDGDLTKARGIGYKKFFTPDQRASVYAIEYDGKKYIYFDFFEDKTLTYSFNSNVKLLESDGVEYTIDENGITAKSKKGYAIFVEE